MKLHRAVWWGLLVLTHVAVFLAAQPADSPAPVREGEASAHALAVAPAKASDRSYGGRPNKAASAHVGLLAELNASDLKDEAYEDARTAIFRDWIKRDLRGALLAIYGPLAGTRHAALVDRLEEELDRELLARAGQVAGWISSGYFGSRHAEVAQLWAKAMVNGGQREVVLASLAELPGESRVAAIDQLCQTAKSPELALLRQWMRPDRQGKLEEYAKRVVRFTGDDPERIFAGEESPELKNALYRAYEERFLDDAMPSQAIAVVGKLPEENRLAALDAIAENGDVEDFTTMLAEMDRRGLWQGIAGDDEVTLVSSAMEVACNSYSSPEDVFHQLSSIARPRTRMLALRKAGEKMSSAVSTIDALGSLPRGAELDAFIKGVVGYGGDHVPPEAWPALLERVSDPVQKQEMEEIRKDPRVMEAMEEEGG